MDTKPLLYGLIGFFIGGLLVSVAATTFDKPEAAPSMPEMVTTLQHKNGDDFDASFIANMIEHHQSAVDMARLSAERAKHEEIKTLSDEIIVAQEKEIQEMKQWQKDWHYQTDSSSEMSH